MTNQPKTTLTMLKELCTVLKERENDAETLELLKSADLSPLGEDDDISE